MSKKKRQNQRLETIAFHSASPSIEATFTAAARDVFGDLVVRRLDDLDGTKPTGLDRALVVIAHPETARSVATLRELRGRGVAGAALLLVQGGEDDFEADLAELGPAAAFPTEGFAPDDLEACIRALQVGAPPLPTAAEEEIEATEVESATSVAVAESNGAGGPVAVGSPVASPVAGGETDEAAAPADDAAAPAQAAALLSLDTDETALLEMLDALRRSRREQVDALGKATGTAQRRLETLKTRLAKTQESLSLEKRQRWEVVLDLRESQERIKEVEERLQNAREGEARRQKDLDAQRIELDQRAKELATATRERDAAHQRFEQAQKGLEKKNDQSRARIEELREETERLREEHAKTTRELEDRVAGLELELEEAKRETGIRAAELQSYVTQRRALETDLLEARETAARDREQHAARHALLEEDGRKLRQRIEQMAQSEGGRVAQLDGERKTAVESLERRTEELSKALASSEAMEKELQQLRAQFAHEREESKAWTAELERELERVRGESAALAHQREGELETLRARHEAARAELESARDEAQGRVAKLQEERDRLDARVRRSSADSGKVSDLRKEIDGLLAELADKEESCVALRTGNESLERELDEARTTLGREKEEASGRLAALVAERGDLERQVQEARDHRQTLERQMASLRAEVVELEVRREEDSERLRELGSAGRGAGQQRVADDVREEHDRLKRELEAMRVDAENTRRALADSDARLRKLQQEKSAARPEPRGKTGDLAIQQLRAELGSLGD